MAYVSAFGVEDNRISKADKHSGGETATGTAVGAAGGGALASSQLRGLRNGRTPKGAPKAIGDGRNLPAARGYLNTADKAKKLRRIAATKVGAGALVGAGLGAGERAARNKFGKK